jgi:histone H3
MGKTKQQQAQRSTKMTENQRRVHETAKKQPRVDVNPIKEVKNKKKSGNVIKNITGLPKTSIGFGGIKKPHRFRPGTVAKREIKKLQRTVEHLVPKAALKRVIDELKNELGDFRMSEGARFNLQEAVEHFVQDYLMAGYVITQEADAQPRPTLLLRHLKAANNVSLRFPGRAVDHSFAERKHVPSQPRTQSKNKNKTVVDATNASKGRDSSIVSEPIDTNQTYDNNESENGINNHNHDNNAPLVDTETVDKRKKKQQQQQHSGKKQQYQLNITADKHRRPMTTESG